MGDILHYAVVTACRAGSRIVFDLHVHGLERYRQQRSTLIVVNHKRDSDSITVPPLLVFNGIRPIRPMWFAGREDMFVTGFLGLQPPVPGLLRPVLVRTNLTRVLHALHILPVRRFPERTLHEALEEFLHVVGDIPVSQVLVPSEREALAASGLRDGTISGLLAWRYRAWWVRKATMRAFLPEWRERLSQVQRDVVESQMQALAAVLDRGDALYLAAEGVLSSDGRLQQFRAGLRRVLALAQQPVRCLPVGITYDFITPGRMRAFIVVGEEVPAAGPPDLVGAQTRRAVAALQTMTASQLCSKVLWGLVEGGQDTVGIMPFAQTVFELAAALYERGLPTDPAILGPDRLGRVRGYLSYLRRRGIVVSDGRDVLVDAPYLRRVPAAGRQNPVRYAVNELESVLATLRETRTGSRKPEAARQPPAP